MTFPIEKILWTIMIFVWAYKFSDTLVVKIIESCVNINSFYKYFLGGLKQILHMKKNFIKIQIWVYPNPE